MKKTIEHIKTWWPLYLALGGIIATLFGYSYRFLATEAKADEAKQSSDKLNTEVQLVKIDQAAMTETLANVVSAAVRIENKVDQLLLNKK